MSRAVLTFVLVCVMGWIIVFADPRILHARALRCYQLGASQTLQGTYGQDGGLCQ